MAMDHGPIEAAVIQAVTARGVGKSVCPSEVARTLATDQGDGYDWRTWMPRVRRAAAKLADRGGIRVTRGGVMVPAIEDGRGGPIRLSRMDDDRPDETPVIELINLGPAVTEDLHRIGCRTLGDLRRDGARRVFADVMMDRLCRGVRKNNFHAMYMYALWGALHDVNCVTLSSSMREYLRSIAAEVRTEMGGAS